MKRSIRRLLDRLRLARCECGGIIWPWQSRVVDVELGWIHAACSEDEFDPSDPVVVALRDLAASGYDPNTDPESQGSNT